MFATQFDPQLASVDPRHAPLDLFATQLAPDSTEGPAVPSGLEEGPGTVAGFGETVAPASEPSPSPRGDHAQVGPTGNGTNPLNPDLFATQFHTGEGPGTVSPGAGAGPGPGPATVGGPATEDLFATRPFSHGPAPRPAPQGGDLAETDDAFATRDHSGSGRDGNGDAGSGGTEAYEPSGAGPAVARADRAPEKLPPPPIRYRALRPHARGGLGEVFVALDEELGREVALKEIQGKHADRAESRARFLIEAEVTGGLEHPGIVPVYGLGQYPDGRPYYAMRFIRGKTLKEAIDSYHEAVGAALDPGHLALELRGLLNRIIDVCNALAYAHTRGILHRDIKPANIMLGAFGETLVVDWGLAKSVDRPETFGESDLRPLKPLSAGHSGSATMYGSTVGTPHFMSPEQAAGELDRLGPQSDVYSIGVTLYCILVGKPPFHESQLAVLLNKVRKGEFPRPREANGKVPRALEAICLKAMALRPEDRYPTARDLADDLEKWLGDEPVSVYREPWTDRLARWARRHKTLVATSASLVLTALLALSIGTVLIRREQARTETNFRLARDAVDQMLTQLGEVELADVPQMETVRRTMLGKALVFYRKFLAERGEDRSLRRETGRANLRLGNIEEMLGDYDAAERAYNRAVTLLAALVAEDPRGEDPRRDLASARHKLGVLLKKSNRFTESEKSLREARRLRHQLVAEHPGNGDDRRDEVDSVYQLGTVFAKLGRDKEVEAAYAEAVEAERKLAEAHPERRDYPRKLGIYLNNRGILLRSTSPDPRQAESAFREALSLQKPLSENSPTVAGLQWERARTTSNLATTLERTQSTAQAVPVYREALARVKQLADDFPTVPDYQNELAVVSFNLGTALTREAEKSKDVEAAGLLTKEAALRLDEAVGIYRRLIQPERFPHRPDFRLRLAQAQRKRAFLLLKTGQNEEAETAFLEAVAATTDLVTRYPQVPEYQSNLGLALQNLAIHLASTGKPLPEARQRLDESIAHQRIALESNAANPEYRRYVLEAFSDLEIILRRSGDDAGAAEAGEAIARLLPGEPGATYRSARLLDLGASLSRRDEVSRSRADLALRRLQQAVKEKARLIPADLNPPAFEAVRSHFPKALEDIKKTVEANVKPVAG